MVGILELKVFASREVGTPAPAMSSSSSKELETSVGEPLSVDEALEQVEAELTGMEVEDDGFGDVDPDDVVELDDSKPFTNLGADDDGLGDAEIKDDSEMEEQGETLKDDAFLVFQEHQDSIYCVAISGTLALTGAGDDFAYLWNLETGQANFKLEGHSDSIVDCGFSADESLCATASYDATVRIWNPKTGKLMHRLDGPSTEIEWLAWHPVGNVIMAGSQDATVWVWDATNGSCLGVLAGHEASVTCGGFTSNGKRIVTGSLDGSVRLWDPKTWTCVHNFSGHGWHDAGVVSLAFHPSEPMIAAGGQDGTARVARLDSKKILATFIHDQGASNGNATTIPSNSESANASATGAVEGDQEQAYIASIETVQFSDILPYLLSGGTNGVVKVWDFNSQTCRQTCKHNETITCVKFVSQSPNFISSSGDGTCRLWDSRNGEQLRILTKHSDMVLDFAFRPEVFVSVGDDKHAHVLRTS